jgi:hypothetical protein
MENENRINLLIQEREVRNEAPEPDPQEKIRNGVHGNMLRIFKLHCFESRSPQNEVAELP